MGGLDSVGLPLNMTKMMGSGSCRKSQPEPSPIGFFDVLKQGAQIRSRRRVFGTVSRHLAYPVPRSVPRYWEYVGMIPIGKSTVWLVDLARQTTLEQNSQLGYRPLRSTVKCKSVSALLPPCNPARLNHSVGARSMYLLGGKIYSIGCLI